MLAATPEDRWIVSRMSDEIFARLGFVQREFRTALIVGGDFGGARAGLHVRGASVHTADPGYAIARSVDGIQCDEDRLPFADQSVDLVLSVGTLDSVNDVPGALVLIRRILKPGGLFLGALAGAGSIPRLRKAMNEGSNDGVARFHPQIDVRAAGDLLARAGFVLPVADLDIVSARYRDADALLVDLRANGLRNVMSKRRALSRSQMAIVRKRFSDSEINGKTAEQFGILYLTAWAPDAKPVSQADR